MIKNIIHTLRTQTRIQQYVIAALAFLILTGLVLVLAYVLFPTGQKRAISTPSPSLEAVGGSLQKEQLWKEKLQQDTESLRVEMGELLESIHKHQIEVQSHSEIQAQLFEDRLQELQNQMVTHTRDRDDSYGGEDVKHPEADEIEMIQHITLRLSAQSPRKSKPKTTVDTTIPAGAFAKSVLLSGLDASTSLSSSSDPRPVLLRIIDMGQLPRSFQSDLKDCHCIASAYGDLSSERVYMRLETLTCIERLTGEIIETEVSGYIAGSDGRVGVRGVVVSKDGPYLMRGLYSGILGGLSDMANPEHQQAFTVSGGNAVQTTPLTPDKLFLSGLGRGASKALDRVAEYNINRAEQLQPVIQIPAGQEVDIVFTKGVFIADSTVKQELSKVRDQVRDKVVAGMAWEDIHTNPSFEGDDE